LAWARSECSLWSASCQRLSTLRDGSGIALVTPRCNRSHRPRMIRRAERSEQKHYLGTDPGWVGWPTGNTPRAQASSGPARLGGAGLVPGLPPGLASKSTPLGHVPRAWTHLRQTTHSGGRDIPRHPFPVVGWRRTACSGAPAGGRGNGVDPGILWIQRNPEALPSSAGPTTCRCRAHPTASRAPCRAEEATRC
jgi:hypothetical protein